MTCVHRTIRLQVWADVDEIIAPLVTKLNSFDGVTTHASCQGTLGEGGAEPYGAYVMASWRKDMEPFLLRNFKVELLGECWGKISEPATPASTGEAVDDFKADNLVGVYCGGNLESIPKDGAIFWEGWQRVVDYVNGERSTGEANGLNHTMSTGQILDEARAGITHKIDICDTPVEVFTPRQHQRSRFYYTAETECLKCQETIFLCGNKWIHADALHTCKSGKFDTGEKVTGATAPTSVPQAEPPK